MEQEYYEFIIEQAIKIIFVINEKLKKWIKKRKVVLKYDYDKNIKWREHYEKNSFDSNKTFQKILNDIFNKFQKRKKIYIDGYLPVPFYVALGAYNHLFLKSKDNFNKAKFKKISVKRPILKIGNRVKLFKKKKICRTPTLLILESKNVGYEKYDFLIKSQKNKFSRNSINHLSLLCQIRKFMIEINKLQLKRKVETINVSIIGSPFTCFLVGKTLAQYNFIFNVYHFSLLHNKNLVKAKIGPYTTITLF